VWVGQAKAVRKLRGALRAAHAPHSHHAAARSAVVTYIIGHFEIVASTQAKCRHCDDSAGESKR